MQGCFRHALNFPCNAIFVDFLVRLYPIRPNHLFLAHSLPMALFATILAVGLLGLSAARGGSLTVVGTSVMHLLISTAIFVCRSTSSSMSTGPIYLCVQHMVVGMCAPQRTHNGSPQLEASTVSWKMKASFPSYKLLFGIIWTSSSNPQGKPTPFHLHPLARW